MDSWITHSNKPRECEPFAYTGFMEKSFQSIPSMTGMVRDVLELEITPYYEIKYLDNFFIDMFYKLHSTRNH